MLSPEVSMIPMPNPLHPAVVHFPIVLILLGTVVACATVFIRRWHLPTIAATLLSLGAVGTMAATITGEQEEEMVGELNPVAEELLDQHEDWGEITRNLAMVAAILAIAAALLGRFPAAAQAAAALTALLALAASFGVAQTGHVGGQMVYKHGVGIQTTEATTNTASTTEARSETKKSKAKSHKEDDDD